MDHNQAVALMAPERYLLDELEPELRDAFEEHLFDCHECALDTRAAAAFLDHTKALLPQMQEDNQAQPAALAAPQPESLPQRQPIQEKKQSWLAALLRPAFLMPILAPACAILLAIVSFQNLVTVPALKAANEAPHLTPWIVLHNPTRGSHQTVPVNPQEGATLVINLPPNTADYSSCTFTLFNPQGKAVWSRNSILTANQPSTLDTTPDNTLSDNTFALTLPANLFASQNFQPGLYRLAVTGLTTTGTTVPLQESTFDLQTHP